MWCAIDPYGIFIHIDWFERRFYQYARGVGESNSLIIQIIDHNVFQCYLKLSNNLNGTQSNRQQQPQHRQRRRQAAAAAAGAVSYMRTNGGRIAHPHNDCVFVIHTIHTIVWPYNAESERLLMYDTITSTDGDSVEFGTYKLHHAHSMRFTVFRVFNSLDCFSRRTCTALL